MWNWTGSYNGKTYMMRIVKTQLLSNSVLPQDVDAKVQPHNPNFILSGDDKALKALADAKPGEKLTLSGDLRYNADPPRLNLDTVQPAPAGK